MFSKITLTKVSNAYIYYVQTILYLNKIVFAISNRKTKTSELLLIKYIKITKLFVIESHHHVIIIH